MNRLDGKIALISGAARGIGAETAREMAAAGASLRPECCSGCRTVLRPAGRTN
jgi:hypothetical protein